MEYGACALLYTDAIAVAIFCLGYRIDDKQVVKMKKGIEAKKVLAADICR
jgi:hypothetical protein